MLRLDASVDTFILRFLTRQEFQALPVRRYAKITGFAYNLGLGVELDFFL